MSSAKKPSFSQAYDELQQIVKDFESQDLDLEKSLPQYKRAAELVKFLQTELKHFEAQIEEIDLKDTPISHEKPAVESTEAEVETDDNNSDDDIPF